MPSPIQVNERVWRVNAPFAGNATQVYVVRGAKLALVDSGVAPSPQEVVEPCLRALGLRLGEVDYIINTHGHNDHMGGNGAVKEAAPGAQVLVHSADRSLVTDGVKAHLGGPFDASRFMPLLGAEDLLPEREATLTRFIGKTAGVDRVLEDGDVIDLGNDVRLRAIHTPGHTAGSTCYLLERDNVLFSGDAVQARGWRPGVLPLYFDTVYVDSIKRLQDVGARTMCMGHAFQWSGVLNDPVRRDDDVAITLRDSLEAAQVIDKAVRDTLAELPKASFREFAHATLQRILFDLPAQLDRKTGAPPHSCACINAHLERARRA